MKSATGVDMKKGHVVVKIDRPTALWAMCDLLDDLDYDFCICHPLKGFAHKMCDAARNPECKPQYEWEIQLSRFWKVKDIAKNLRKCDGDFNWGEHGICALIDSIEKQLKEAGYKPSTEVKR